MQYMAMFGFKPPKVIFPHNTEGFKNIQAKINATPTGMILTSPAVDPVEKMQFIESLSPAQQRQVGRDYTRMSNIKDIQRSQKQFATESAKIPKQRRNINNPRFTENWLGHQDNMATAVENNDRFAKQVLPEYQNMANRNNNIAVLRRMAKDM